MKEGIVYKSTGSWYIVKSNDNQFFRCRLKGKFKIQGLKVTNPIAVGDSVKFDLEEGMGDQGVITNILPRKNYLIRKSVHKSEHAHLLASNLDYLVFVFTLSSPKTSLGFLDRFLVSAETFRIPVLIVFNKIDLYSVDELEIIDSLSYLYESLGYETLKMSALQNEGEIELLKKLEGKTILFSGHSGVGKSSILNMLDPDLELHTSEISDFSNKGTHTTTFAEMFEFGNGIRIIDSPGIKELGLMEVERSELSHYFPEFRKRIGECKFHNCLHIHEPKCKIKELVEENTISPTRYQSYLSMYKGEDNRR
ncbi:MAG: ribosome small subunit-dependent GTPase A [Leadbetterella sp.]